MYLGLEFGKRCQAPLHEPSNAGECALRPVDQAIGMKHLIEEPDISPIQHVVKIAQYQLLLD
jgi:hypothetical protein